MKAAPARAQKLLSERGVASRRHAEALIKAGRVTSRGKRVAIGEKLAPDAPLEVDGARAATAVAHRYVLLNKPVGIVSTVRDERGRMVAVTIPAMGRQDIKVSNPTAGTVPATVTALDAPQSQAQVETQQGQRLVLTLPPELLVRMRVGDRFLLQVAPPSGQ